jgi:hypothetical protein
MLVMSTLVLLLGSLGMLAAYMSAPEPHKSGGPIGLTFGILGATGIATALSLGARKKLANHGLGRRESWTQFHMVIGSLGFVAALAHAGFAVTGVFATFLMLLFAVEIATGVYGQILYSTVPPVLTRLERSGNAKLIEDLLEEQMNLREGIHEIVLKAPPGIKQMAAGLKRLAGGNRLRYRKDYDSQAYLSRVHGTVKMPPHLANHRPTVDRLLHDYHRLADVRAQLRLHRRLKRWLVLHLAVSGALATFLLIHIAVMAPLVF